MTEQYDLLVIGAGSGGIAAANRVASYGQRCAVFEHRNVGGTCVNLGCVPKKVMWHAAHIAQAMQDAQDYGFSVNVEQFDWSNLINSREIYIERLRGIYAHNLDKNAVSYIAAPARFVEPKVLLADGQRYSAEHIIIASGGRPIRPKLPGAELGITSDEFFGLSQQPRSMIIVGAGYIAVELAGMLAALGTQVTLLLRKEYPVRSFDPMLQQRLFQALQEQGVTVLTQRQVKQVQSIDAGIQLQTEQDDRLSAEQLLWAVGRTPNTEDLNLTAAGVESDAQGYITTDQWQNTNVAGIYAVGDVTGRAALTPVAIAAGRRLADRLFNNQPDRYLDYELIPTVLFTHPPIGTIGMTETEARQQYGDAVKIYQHSFTSLGNAFTRHKPPTEVKLIVHGDDEKIIGCHIIGPGADEMLQGFAVAIRMGANKRDFDNTVAIHPTMAEELVTLR